MNIEKLDIILCIAFQCESDLYPVSIMFGEIREFAYLSKSEIMNLSSWNECSSIKIENILPDRRWRKRSTIDRRYLDR